MFNIVKLLFVFTFIKTNKKALSFIAALIICLILMSTLFEDIFSVIDSQNQVVWLFVKWITLIVINSVIAFKVFQLIKSSKSSLKRTKAEDVTTCKYKKTIDKELYSKGDKIKQKYRKLAQEAKKV